MNIVPPRHLEPTIPMALYESVPVEYAKLLRAILLNDPLLTCKELGLIIGKPQKYILDMMNLRNTKDPRIISLINNQTISLIYAFELAKIPPDEQYNFWVANRMLDRLAFNKKVQTKTGLSDKEAECLDKMLQSCNMPRIINKIKREGQ